MTKEERNRIEIDHEPQINRRKTERKNEGTNRYDHYGY